MEKVYDCPAPKTVSVCPFLVIWLRGALEVILMKSRLRLRELVTTKLLPHERTGMACSNTWSKPLPWSVGTQVRVLPLKTAIFLQSEAMTCVPLRSRRLPVLVDLTW